MTTSQQSSRYNKLRYKDDRIPCLVRKRQGCKRCLPPDRRLDHVVREVASTEASWVDYFAAVFSDFRTRLSEACSLTDAGQLTVWDIIRIAVIPHACGRVHDHDKSDGVT